MYIIACAVKVGYHLGRLLMAEGHRLRQRTALVTSNINPRALCFLIS
jgi:hypothetical protein